MNLRDYQEKCHDITVHRLKKELAPFIDMLATGAGKSHIIAASVDTLRDPCLILQPNKEILIQNYSKYLDRGFGATIYSASAGRKEISEVTFATIGSIKDYNLFKHFKYLFIDECDVVNPSKENSMYMKFINEIRPKGVVGLTATPYRLVSKYHEDVFGNPYITATVVMLNHIKPYFFNGGIQYKMEAHELQQLGYLCPVKYHKVGNPTGSKLRIKESGLDFTDESLVEDAAEREPLVVTAIKYALENHKKVLVFTAGIGSCHKLQKELEEKHNIRGEVVTSLTDTNSRNQIVNDFKDTRIRLVINHGVLLAGFDCVDLDAIIWDRSTLSPRIWSQGGGRAFRTDPDNPGKVSHIYDLSGTLTRMGKIEDLRVVTERNGWKQLLMGYPLNAKAPVEITNKPLYTYYLKQ